MLTARHCLTCACGHAWVLRFQMLLDQEEQSTPSSSASDKGIQVGLQGRPPQATAAHRTTREPLDSDC